MVHTFVEWCKANPTIAWPIFSALVVTVFKPRTPLQYASMSAIRPQWLFSRLAALLQLIGALGLDPVKALQVASKVITGRQNDGTKIVAFFIFTLALMSGGCMPNEVVLEGSIYAEKLSECSRVSATLCESIACENRVRGAAGRMPRPVPNHCKAVKDAGSDQ